MTTITPEHYQNLQRQQRMLLDQAFNNIDWDSETSPPETAPDLELFATARDIDSVADGNELLTNGFCETLFFKAFDDSYERPSPYQNKMSGVLPREPGTYDLSVMNASVFIDNVNYTNRSETIELFKPEVLLNGWQSNASSSISLMRPGATGKFGQTFESGSILRDARFSGTNSSLRTESTDVAFEQESSSIWGGSYALLFELAKEFGCDLWLTMSHLMCDPNPNPFFFSDLRGHVTEFPNKVYIQNSTELNGINDQSSWISEQAQTYYPNDSDPYASMVGRLAGTCAGQMNAAGVKHVVELGFSVGMLTEFTTASGGLVPDYWCTKAPGSDEREWALLKQKD